MMCLMVANQSHANGAPVVEYDYMNSGYDQWVLEKADQIAELTIFSLPSGGHSWLTIKNNIGAAIKAGFYEIAPGEEISIGTFGNQPGHVGVWYNIESHYANSAGYLGRVSLSEIIGANELIEITSYIKSHDTWSVYFNCSRFAATVWNNATNQDIDINFISTPTAVANAMRQKSGYQINRSFQKHDKIGYKSSSTDVFTQVNSAIIDSLSSISG